MSRVWGFLSDPGLHLLTIALILIALALGTPSSRENPEDSRLIACVKCQSYHYPSSDGSCPARPRVAQARP